MKHFESCGVQGISVDNHVIIGVSVGMSDLKFLSDVSSALQEKDSEIEGSLLSAIVS